MHVYLGTRCHYAEPFCVRPVLVLYSDSIVRSSGLQVSLIWVKHSLPLRQASKSRILQLARHPMPFNYTCMYRTLKALLALQLAPSKTNKTSFAAAAAAAVACRASISHHSSDDDWEKTTRLWRGGSGATVKFCGRKVLVLCDFGLLIKVKDVNSWLHWPRQMRCLWDRPHDQVSKSAVTSVN